MSLFLLVLIRLFLFHESAQGHARHLRSVPTCKNSWLGVSDSFPVVRRVYVGGMAGALSRPHPILTKERHKWSSFC
jgi:hypothetical protein